MKELCVCGCDREVKENSSFYSDECSFNYNPNDVPYEKDDNE